MVLAIFLFAQQTETKDCVPESLIALSRICLSRCCRGNGNGNKEKERRKGKDSKTRQKALSSLANVAAGKKMAVFRQEETANTTISSFSFLVNCEPCCTSEIEFHF